MHHGKEKNWSFQGQNHKRQGKKNDDNNNMKKAQDNLIQPQKSGTQHHCWLLAAGCWMYMG